MKIATRGEKWQFSGFQGAPADLYRSAPHAHGSPYKTAILTPWRRFSPRKGGLICAHKGLMEPSGHQGDADAPSFYRKKPYGRDMAGEGGPCDAAQQAKREVRVLQMSTSCMQESHTKW